MTKCQKITFFDSFLDICQNHTFPLFPIFPKNQKITIFHYGGDFCKIPHFPKNPIFDPFPKNPKNGLFWDIPKIPQNPKNAIFQDIPKIAKNGVFQDIPKNGLFYPYPKSEILGRCGVRLPPHALYRREYLTNPWGVFLYFFNIYILIIYFG